jgi:aspartyl-tRNA(Asn)/glutamyl-tRNA(Gln) amidotransferase subunit A
VSDLLGLTAAQQAELIASGEVSGAEVFEFWRDRAAADDLGAYLWVADEVPAHPGALPPVAVKDLFCVEGVPSSAGSRILEGYLPVYTATSVRNLHEAGAVVLGKTNQDEFAMGSSNENSGYGPVQNPWDRTRVPGGSSGGSALGDRHGHWRLRSPAGPALRPGRAQADLRDGQPLRDDRVRLLARPVLAFDAGRDRRGGDAARARGA